MLFCDLTSTSELNIAEIFLKLLSKVQDWFKNAAISRPEIFMEL